MFVDSVVWIALKYKRDQWHQPALKLKHYLEDEGSLYITDYIIVETYNFLLRKVSSSVALETLNMFLTSSKIQILFNDSISIKNSHNILTQFEQLSLTDANMVLYCRLLNIKRILSFDDGFDAVDKIIRVFN